MLNFLLNTISGAGYIGIFFLMLVASAAIPLPSEVIMAFSGFLVSAGRFSLSGVTIAGTLGSLAGSLILYYLGLRGGRPLVEKYGKYVLLSSADLEKTERFFAKYGDTSNFIGRLLPIIRTFISFPAGLARMKLNRFVFYTLLGSVIWTFILAFLGEKLGEHWATLNQTFHRFNIVLGVLIVAGAIWYVYRHVAGRKK